MKRIILILLIVPLFTGCFGPQGLQRQINKERSLLLYLPGTPTSLPKLDASISPVAFDSTHNSNITMVEKTKGYAVWLLIIYIANYDVDIKLGKNSFSPTISDFLNYAFQMESKYAGKYSIKDTSGLLTKYKLELVMDDYSVSADYNRSEFGFILLPLEPTQVKIEPSKGHSKITARLYNLDNNLVFTKSYYTKAVSNYNKRVPRKLSESNILLLDNMNETLAKCIQDAVTNLVSDLNTFLSQ